jgi:hypothetical protein
VTGSYAKRELNQNLSGHELFYTNSLISPENNMLRSKLHCKKGSNLILFLYTICLKAPHTISPPFPFLQAPHVMPCELVLEMDLPPPDKQPGKEFGGPLPCEEEALIRIQGYASESQGQNLILTVLYIPSSLDSGTPGAPQPNQGGEAVRACTLMVYCIGHRVDGGGMRFEGLGFRAQGLGFKVGLREPAGWGIETDTPRGVPV